MSNNKQDNITTAVVLIVAAIVIVVGAIVITSVIKDSLYKTVYVDKQEVYRDSVENTKVHIDNMREQLREQHPDWTDEELKDNVIDSLRDYMYSQEYTDESYMWVHEIENYDGGDKYAKRLIHPNLKNMEGAQLSTNTVDIEGNMPYKEELEGIKKDGHVFFTYNFKELNSDLIRKKLTYSSLYPYYNWIISRGVSVNRIDKEARDSFNSELPVLITVIVIYGILVFLMLIYVIYLLRKLENVKNDRDTYAREVEMVNMASKAKVNFIFSVSHDVREHTENVIKYNNLAMEDTGDERQVREYLFAAKKSAEELDKIITEAGKMALIDSKDVVLDESIVDIRSITKDIDKAITSAAEDKNINLSIKDKAITHYKVYADRIRLRQISMILLTNALRYTKSGGTVECIFEELDSKKDGYALYRLVVADTGVGMTEGVARDIFDLIIEDEDSENLEGQNTKLELNVCKRIVESFGGDIRVDTKRGRGTKIIVELPLKIGEQIGDKE